MTTFTFTATGGDLYNSNGSRDYAGYFEQGGSNWNSRTIILFDTNAIRTQLSGYTITSCTFNFYVTAVGGSQARLFFGTHNYTSLPSSFTSSRLSSNRVQYVKNGTGQVTGLNLGTTIGTELRDGTSTGILFGPVPSGYDNDDESALISTHSDSNQSRRPVLVITAELTNQAPNAPTLNTPAANAVVNAGGSLGFNWQHSDPNGDPQAAWHFRRRKPDGTYDYWDGSNFVATDTRLTQTMAPLTNGVMTIPANKWGNGLAYSWAVRTEDPAGAIGPWSAERILYTSTPPTTTVTGPTGNINSARPTLTWTRADVDGNAQYGYAAQVVPQETYSALDFNPDNYLGTAWSASADTSATSVTLPKDLVNHKAYRAYIKTSSSPNPSGGLQWSGWSYTSFSVVIPPYASTVTFPQNGSIIDLRAGFTLTWRNSYFSNIGSQTAFAVRRIIAGGSYQWWNGAAWGPTEIFLAGSAAQFAFRANEVLNGATYTFSVAIRDDYNQVSPYSSGTTVTASSVAQVNVVAPLGVSVTTRPTVTWTVYDLENDPQQTYQVRILSEDVYTGTSDNFNPGAATAVWDTGEIIDVTTRNITVATDLQNATNYRAYVRVKTGGQYSAWSYAEFNVSLVPPATPTARAIARHDDGVIDIIVQARDSMLGDTTSRNANGWEPDTNCTVINGIFFASAHSHLASSVTSTAASTISARTIDEYPVEPGFTYTAGVTVIAPVDVTPVTAYCVIEWLNANMERISMSFGNAVTDTAAIRTAVTAQAPETADTARIVVQFQNVQTVGAVHRFFDPVLRPSTGSEWSPGGLLGSTAVSIIEINDQRIVRFGLNVPLSNETQQVIIHDEEAPIGKPVQYEVITRAVYPNAILVSAPTGTSAVFWTSGWLWLSDPLRPGSGRAFIPQKFGSIERPVRQGKFRPIGREDAVITTGTRGLREGSYTILTPRRVDREAYEELTELTNVFLLRMPADQGEVEGEAYYVKFDGGSPQDRPVPTRTPHRTINQSWTEQRRPMSLLEYDGSDV